MQNLTLVWFCFLPVRQGPQLFLALNQVCGNDPFTLWEGKGSKQASKGKNNQKTQTKTKNNPTQFYKNFQQFHKVTDHKRHCSVVEVKVQFYYSFQRTILLVHVHWGETQGDSALVRGRRRWKKGTTPTPPHPRGAAGRATGPGRAGRG